MKKNMKNQKGFSLIELLVVIIIIGIIAAIAIPSLLSSRRAANEAAAVGNTRTLITANATYQSTLGSGQTYAADLAALSTAKLIDTSLSGATASATAKSGYYYTYATASAATTYTVLVTPTGTYQKSYFADETGTIRYAGYNAADGAAVAAGASSPAIQ